MLERIQEQNELLIRNWEQLGFGAPTVIALAHLCSLAMVRPSERQDSLSPESKTILHAARERGVFEIKCDNNAYESAARFLMVFVEVNADTKVRFGNNRNPELNIRYLDGFRQLCDSGLVMHQLYHEFSLTKRGFDRAKSLSTAEILPWPSPPASGELTRNTPSEAPPLTDP